ncbi:MAG: RNA ligase family protein [Bacteroidota bacterium]
MNESRKYGRSLHAQISLGTTSDDRFMPDGYVAAFAEMEGLVLTEKLDGQNNCFNKYGVFARSHTSPSVHPWDKPLRERWQLIKDDLKDLEVFGENMYGIHSIAYANLESYFYVFGVREGEQWLSWEEVQFYAAMLDFPTVPEIPITKPLQEMYTADRQENEVLVDWLKANLGMTWTESVAGPGYLGGYDPKTGKPCSEGFVIRNKAIFKMNEGPILVASNEFNNLFKLVRAKHVKSDVHWTKTWKAASLIDCEKYKWFGYEYLNHQS